MSTEANTTSIVDDNFEEALAAFRGAGGIQPDAPAPDTAVAAASEPDATAPTNAPTPPATETAPQSAPVAAPDKPASDPAIAALLEREAAIEAHKAKVDEAEALLRDKYQAYLDFEKARADFKRDPAAFVRALGPDVALADVAERLYMEELGDAAPIEHRIKAETTQVSREVQELRAELERERQYRIAAQQEQQRNEYRQALKAHAVDAAKQPLLANLAKLNTDRFVQELYTEAYEEAVRTKGEVVLTPAQAAERAEARLARVRDELFGPAAVAQTQGVPAAEKPAASTTLWSADVGSEQAPKKAPEELDDRAQLEAALKASGWTNVKPWV